MERSIDQTMTETKRGLIPPARGWGIPALIVFLINLFIFLGVSVGRPEYLKDYRLNLNPDAVDYVALGRNFILRGSYSRCPQPPYVPDMLRTPVYPIFVGVLDIVGGAGSIYVAQAALQIASCILIYGIARRRFGPGAAFWASLLASLDVMAAVSNFEAMSEPLFTFLVLASIATMGFGTPGNPIRFGRTQFWRDLVGGLLLALATLTRPVGLYLIPLLAIRPIRAVATRTPGRLLGIAGVFGFLLGSLVPVGLWMTRNGLRFGIPRLTTVDTQNVVYFFGAGAYQLRHGMTLDEAQSRISDEFQIPRYEVLQNPWIVDEPLDEMDARVRSVRSRVLRRYPKELAMAGVAGVAKAAFSHNVGSLAAMLGGEWDPPGLSSIARGDRRALDRLSRNGPVLAGAFFWETSHATLTLLLAAPGIFLALNAPATRRGALILLAVLAYFEGTVMLFGLEAYCRCRLPALPFLYVFAGVAASARRGGGASRPAGAETEGRSR